MHRYRRLSVSACRSGSRYPPWAASRLFLHRGLHTEVANKHDILCAGSDILRSSDGFDRGGISKSKGFTDRELRASSMGELYASSLGNPSISDDVYGTWLA